MLRTSSYPLGLTLGGILVGSLVFAVTTVAVIKPSSGERARERIEEDRAALPEKIVVVTDEMTATSIANGRFAVDLYRQLAETEPGRNLLLSPFSISLALSMVAEGAIDETRDQMTDVLRYVRGNLARMHQGQRELQAAVVPDVPPEVATRLARLRAELKASNKRTEEFTSKKRWNDADASWKVASKLATEINLLTSKTSAYELRVANSLWLEKSYPIAPTFIAALEPNYGTVLFPVDFKTSPEPARLQINQWVAEQTNDRIQDILPPLSINILTRLVIANAVFFKGDWAQPFEISQTRPEQFQQSSDRSTEVAMMHQWNGLSARYGAFQSDGELFPTPHEIKFDLKDDDPSLYPDSKGHTMLSLDYQGRKIQMIFLVPQSAEGLLDLEKSLTHEKLEQWIVSLEQRLVQISIPKYSLKWSKELSATLRSLGMVRPFEGSDESRFDAVTTSNQPGDPLWITQVQHQTFIDVSEIGTEAAAATVVSFDVSAEVVEVKTRPFHPIFKADKPFIFLIRDRETASVLFMGRYVGPTD